jgi:hypothetical protein
MKFEMEKIEPRRYKQLKQIYSKSEIEAVIKNLPTNNSP